MVGNFLFLYVLDIGIEGVFFVGFFSPSLLQKFFFFYIVFLLRSVIIIGVIVENIRRVFERRGRVQRRGGERGEVISYIVIVVYFLPVYKVDQPLLLGVVGVLRREIISVVEVVFEVLGHYFIVETRLFVCWFFIFLAITNTNITNIIINLLK